MLCLNYFRAESKHWIHLVRKKTTSSANFKNNKGLRVSWIWNVDKRKRFNREMQIFEWALNSYKFAEWTNKLPNNESGSTRLHNWLCRLSGVAPVATGHPCNSSNVLCNICNIFQQYVAGTIGVADFNPSALLKCEVQLVRRKWERIRFYRLYRRSWKMGPIVPLQNPSTSIPLAILKFPSLPIQ